ncbi:MAG: hypothetical protein A2W30_08215 [Ignavibacteria bacterium RBG_16_36_9]|nr:MAG: hypothetical protein A2W30_08215 [Ignavibacteria bacterium RBG_16_36_9]
MSKENSIDQLRFFLKEMFQFNANDLDFGIYRIYNLKRKEIENFIDGKDKQCLEPIILETLNELNLKSIESFRNAITEYLIDNKKAALAKDIDGNYNKIKQLIIDYEEDERKKVRQLENLEKGKDTVEITDEIKDKIYNHILGYFEMYYSNGDFGYNNRSRNLYKVPYEADYDGNDTMFHWKHKGSLYIKTGNSFNAIKFKLKLLDREFELRLETNEKSKEEEVARNNNKDNKLKHYKFNRFEEKNGVTRIIFNLSDASTTKADLFKSLFKEVFKSKEKLDNYLFVDDKPVFNDLTDDYDKVDEGKVKGIGALRVNRKTLLKKVNKNFERDSKIEIITENGQDRFSDKILETLYNIDQKLNSFYIGNDSDYFIHENLQEFLTQEKERYIKNHILSDLKSILDGKLDNTTIIIAKAFDLVTSRIIEFLSAIEEFQKKLFTMKKKVVESEYCLTIDNIDEKYYKEILENKAQITEWENLFSVKVKTLADLKAQPTLVLDTKFFKQKDGSNPFKDKILAEIENLDERTNGLLINSENYQGLIFLLDKYNKQVTGIYIDPPYNTGGDGFVYKDHFKHSSWLAMIDNRVRLSKHLLKDSGVLISSIDDHEDSSLTTLFKSVFGISNFVGKLIVIRSEGGGLAKQMVIGHDYALVFANDISVFTPLKKPKDIRGKIIEKDSKEYWIEEDWLRREFGKYGTCLYDEIEEVKGIEKKKEIDEGIKNGIYQLITKQNGDVIVGRLRLIEEDGSKFYTILKHLNADGKDDLKKLGLDNQFSFPKPLSLLNELIKGATFFKVMEKKYILDYFAGSGTTGHAIIDLNRDDSGNRKYILCEMGSYFNAATKPRIQKAIYSKNWSDGTPVDNNGSFKHIFRYLVLEQYEDVLNAIEAYEGEIPKNLPLKYLYKPELNKINSTLDLSKPFSNKIRYGQPTKEGFVDLVDTYNYLQGYEVKSIKTYTIHKKYYKVVETADTLAIWRDIALGEDDSKAIKEIAEKYPEATRVEVNYDFNILATLKDRQLQVGKRLLDINIIHADIFNQ